MIKEFWHANPPMYLGNRVNKCLIVAIKIGTIRLLEIFKLQSQNKIIGKKAGLLGGPGLQRQFVLELMASNFDFRNEHDSTHILAPAYVVGEKVMF